MRKRLSADAAMVGIFTVQKREYSVEKKRNVEDAEKAIDQFLDKNKHCFTCISCKYDLLGPYCISPEYPLGYIGSDKSTCEMHNFKDTKLKKELEHLQEIWYQCWEKEYTEDIYV
jgi:hypothetical protein